MRVVQTILKSEVYGKHRASQCSLETEGSTVSGFDMRVNK